MILWTSQPYRDHFNVFYTRIQLKENLLVYINATNDFLNEKDLDGIYSDNNEYGGHFSKKGNKKVAEIIYRELEKLDLITND